jgi:hypothetical protein
MPPRSGLALNGGGAPPATSPRRLSGEQETRRPDLVPPAQNAPGRPSVSMGTAYVDAPPAHDFVGMPRLTVRHGRTHPGLSRRLAVFRKKDLGLQNRIGNAFPPPVACAVGKRIAAALRQAEKAASARPGDDKQHNPKGGARALLRAPSSPTSAGSWIPMNCALFSGDIFRVGAQSAGTHSQRKATSSSRTMTAATEARPVPAGNSQAATGVRARDLQGNAGPCPGPQRIHLPNVRRGGREPHPYDPTRKTDNT